MWYGEYVVCYYDLLRTLECLKFLENCNLFYTVYESLTHCFPSRANGNVRVVVIVVSKSLEYRHFRSYLSQDKDCHDENGKCSSVISDVSVELRVSGYILCSVTFVTW